jgi:hypothetical protein
MSGLLFSSPIIPLPIHITQTNDASAQFTFAELLARLPRE